MWEGWCKGGFWEHGDESECRGAWADNKGTEYLDSDNSGTHTECVTDNISTAFSPLADWLRTNKRQALNSETGGGNTASCQKYLCQQIDFVK